MLSLTYLKAKLIGLGAILLSVLYFFIRFKSVKAQRDRAEIKADTLEARIIQERIKKKLKDDLVEREVSHRADLLRELEKEDEDFKGLDNLSDPNKY